MLIVDAVASAGGMPVKMDAWGVDVMVSASQKALAVPPGLAFAACSERAMERSVTLPGRGMYLDLARYDEFWRRGETLGTPALSVLFALDAQLEIIEAEGLERRYMRHIAMRSAVTKWVAAAHARHLPVSFLAAAEHRAPTVSCLRYEGDCADLVERLAHVLKNLGCRHGFVVHGMDGMDEITLTAETRLAEVTPEKVVVTTLKPEDLGLTRCRMADLRGGDASENAVIVKAVLAGEKGPKRDIVLVNAAFGLVAAGKAAAPEEGLRMAAESIDSGRAMEQLQKLIKMTNESGRLKPQPVIQRITYAGHP
jgi:hypothetical protein